VGSTLHRVRPADTELDEVPIGQPMPGESIHLVDADLAEVGTGEVGEIVIGGVGLAHGYLDNLAATAERFVALPRADPPGRPPVRVYRTGDLGVRDADGCLRYRGRRDRQVKINGVRIELLEVEHVAQRVPGVGRAVAVALPVGAPSPDRLAVFVGADADVDRVRQMLTDHLPAAVGTPVVLASDRLPLNGNGKVDVARLASDARLGAPAQVAVAARPATPSDAVERLVVDSARRVLGRDDILLDDDFFTVGGTSLHAIRLAAALSHELETSVSVETLMIARKLDRLCAAIRSDGSGGP
jgi:acyl-CoA synthetase (AMP-forming)/AMP-acid ligase II